MLRKCQGELLKSDHVLAYVSFLPHDIFTGGIPHAGSRQVLVLERTQPRKTVMVKLVRTTGRIQVMCLMARALGCTVEGPMVSDAARRVRVKPLYTPQTQQMPPRPPDSVPLLCRQLAPISWRPLR